MMVKIQFKRLPHGEGLPLPQRMTPGAAAMDVCSAETKWIPSGQVVLFKTGFSVAIPRGFEMQVRSRSGLAKSGLMIANSPGVVDSDYRGELGVMIYNSTSQPREISRGDRIAQLTINHAVEVFVDEVDALDETERADSGFGSTGR